MFKYLYSFLFILISTVSVHGQVSVNSNGNVSFDGDASIDGTVEIGNPSSYYHQLAVKCGISCGASYIKYGIFVTAEDGSSNQYGVYSKSLGSGNNYGILGYAEFGNVNRGVVGAASGSNSYGGYFTNGLYVSGGITQSSDERLKKNIRALERTTIASKISQLQPKKFEFLTEQELKLRGLPASYSASGVHFGLLAQDLEEVFPELVSDVVHNVNQVGAERSKVSQEPELVTTKAINYQELTILLLATVQELQMKVEVLEKRIK